MMKTGVDRRGPASSQGLTLLELLVAATIASILLVALTDTTQLFGTQVADLRTEEEQGLETSLIEVSEAVRYGWLVDAPTASSLRVLDPFGRSVLFRFDAASERLELTTPHGVVGSLLEDVADVDFSLQTIRRLRDDAPIATFGPFWSQASSGTTEDLTLWPGDAVAVAFSVPTKAPPDIQVLSDVEEEYVSTTIESIAFTVGVLDMRAMEFCHVLALGPPHNPSHQDEPLGDLLVEVYKARSFGDARPYGPPLVTSTIPTETMPPLAYKWVDTLADTDIIAPEVVDPPSGVAWGWWEDNPQVVLVVEGVATPTQVDVSALGPLGAGEAYTIVLRSHGYARILLQTEPADSAEGTGVSIDTGSGWIPATRRIPLTLQGTRLFTQTSEHTPVSLVTTTIRMTDGRELGATANVQNQAAVEDPWSGAVPGELPSLETDP